MGVVMGVIIGMVLGVGSGGHKLNGDVLNVM